MRTTMVAIALVMAGCAGQPTTPAEAPTRYVNATGAVQPTTSESDLDAKRLAEAKKRGFTLVNTNGEELFCRSDFKTGSHVERNTTCLTAAELDSMHDETRQSLRNYERPIPFDPRMGH